MTKKIMYLSGFLGLFYLGVLAIDLLSEPEKGLVLKELVSPAQAMGCGVGYLNHQAPDPIFVPCWYGPGATQFTIEEQHDCKDSADSCCRFPDLGSPCPTLGSQV